MFCANCGEKLEEGTKFCTNCGTATDQATAPVQQPQGAYQQTVPTNNPGAKNAWQYFTGAFKKYAVFRGRARRAEFWWFLLFATIINIVLAMIDGFFGFILYYSAAGQPTGIFSTLWQLAIVLPGWGLLVRRMHDCDKAGPFCLIPIYSLVLCCTEGTKGSNRFGNDPKQE